MKVLGLFLLMIGLDIAMTQGHMAGDDTGHFSESRHEASDSAPTQMEMQYMTPSRQLIPPRSNDQQQFPRPGGDTYNNQMPVTTRQWEFRQDSQDSRFDRGGSQRALDFGRNSYSNRDQYQDRQMMQRMPYGYSSDFNRQQGGRTNTMEANVNLDPYDLYEIHERDREHLRQLNQGGDRMREDEYPARYQDYSPRRDDYQTDRYSTERYSRDPYSRYSRYDQDYQRDTQRDAYPYHSEMRPDQQDQYRDQYRGNFGRSYN